MPAGKTPGKISGENLFREKFLPEIRQACIFAGKNPPSIKTEEYRF